MLNVNTKNPHAISEQLKYNDQVETSLCGVIVHLEQCSDASWIDGANVTSEAR